MGSCNVCEGRRFSHETLEVRFKDHSIADVLNLEIRDALKLFESFQRSRFCCRHSAMSVLITCSLGRPPQRSAAAKLSESNSPGNSASVRPVELCISLMNPPPACILQTCTKLLDVLHGFVNDGNTVIVIEHNLDVIKTADWILDIGRKAGQGAANWLLRELRKTWQSAKRPIRCCLENSSAGIYASPYFISSQKGKEKVGGRNSQRSNSDRRSQPAQSAGRERGNPA